MKFRPLASTLAAPLAFVVLAPSAFLFAPPTVYAAGGVPVDDFITQIKETLNLVSTYTNTAANVATEVNAYVLQPLAFVLSGNLMKLLTSSVLNFVIGKANGTGIPQFVTDVQKSLQTVGDAKALAFFDQFGRNSNSPFASSITSSLRNDYLSKTSLAGFWAANMNTLAQSTPSYQPGFLTGNWQQGGVQAWFALTTQTQNNPYTLYQNSQSQMGTLIGPGVGGATGARLAQLNWGQGFASWCGASDSTLGALTTTNTASPTSCPAGSNYITSSGQCEYGDGSKATPISSSTGTNPGDPCTNKDGTSGTIKTPGSVIAATLNKVLGGQQDIITRMGNVGPQINQILGNIATVMQTAQFASQLLGGSGSGGLFGVDQTSASNPTSRLVQYQTSTSTLGVTNSSVYQGATSLSVSGADMTNQITQYQSAWNTITATANAASTSVTSLATFCTAAADTAAQAIVNAPVDSGDGYLAPPSPSQTNLSRVTSPFISAARAQATAAQNALTTEIVPVFVQANTASSIIATAQAAVQKIQNELNSGIDTTGSAYSADIAALQTMRPTAQDVGTALQNAQVMSSAAASPAGSLTVTAGSLVDQMSLISTNAATLKTTVCNPNSSLYVTPTTFGNFSGG